MLPVPTTSALFAFAGLTAMLALGLALESSEVVVLANGGYLGLALAFAATVPLGRRVRRQRLEFAWWVAHADDGTGTVVVPDAPFEVRCYVRHRGAAPLWVRRLSVIAGPAAIPLGPQDLALHVRGRARTEFTLPFRAASVGRLVLHGLSMTVTGPGRLFEMPLYFPNPMTIKVLPRAARRPPVGSRTVRGTPVSRSGRNVLRRRGGGTELHELRELLPGDPFRSIAWKASARAGRLMVKEVEREVQETLWLVLDLGGSLREGPPGARALDSAIELAATEARRAIDAGDRVGLTTVDGRILASLPPADGPGQLLRIYDTLLSGAELVDDDLTTVDDAEVTRIVAAYVLQQDGLDFRRRSDRSKIDVTGLCAHVASRMTDERPAVRPRAATREGSTLRLFCRARGIALPHRTDDPDHGKERAIADALQLLCAHRREPSRVVVISDLEGVRGGGPVRTGVQLLRARGHEVLFLVMSGAAPDARRERPLARSLRRIDAMERDRRSEATRRALHALGARLLLARSTTPRSPRPVSASDAGRAA